MNDSKITVVIPYYEVKHEIMAVLDRISSEVSAIYVVDDKCPQGTGNYVRENCRDPRVDMVFHESNLGVGGPTISGYRKALAGGAQIIVKVDGDGQMDPVLDCRLTNQARGVVTPAGTVMLAAMPVILGFQLLVAAVSLDVGNVPKVPLHLRLT
jgi:glycosyltransferase involved in cell wall biosynthesis